MNVLTASTPDELSPLMPSTLEIVSSLAGLATLVILLVVAVLALTDRLSTRDTIAYVVLALVLPVVGPLAAWVWRRAARRTAAVAVAGGA